MLQTQDMKTIEKPERMIIIITEAMIMKRKFKIIVGRETIQIMKLLLAITFTSIGQEKLYGTGNIGIFHHFL